MQDHLQAIEIITRQVQLHGHLVIIGSRKGKWARDCERLTSMGWLETTHHKYNEAMYDRKRE